MNVALAIQTLAFLTLFGAIAEALFSASSRWSRPLAGISLLAAFSTGMVNMVGLPLIGIAVLLLAGSRTEEGPDWRRTACLWLLALWALAAGLHWLPGFAPLEWSHEFGREGDKLLRWNYDKGCAGLLLLWALDLPRNLPQTLQEWRARLNWLPAGVALVLALGWLLGIANPQPAWMAGTGAWLVGNLFLTVVAEEVFFRGLLQTKLSLLFGRILNPIPKGASLHTPITPAYWPALVATALLFTIAHAGWGWQFASIAFVASLFYGHMFGRQASLLWAVLAHFLVNAATLLLMHSPLG